MDRILIPARRNSKGFPFKNRVLLERTLSKIPEGWKDRTTVITDDEEIARSTEGKGFQVFTRSPSTAVDTASVRECLTEATEGLWESSVITMLYLTYPNRTWGDLMRIWRYWQGKEQHDIRSLLCRKKPETHPWLTITELDSKDRAEQLIGSLTGENHDLYRRQDYPEVWEISHFVSMFKKAELEQLNGNLYNPSTMFFKLDNKTDTTDIDEPTDFYARRN